MRLLLAVLMLMLAPLVAARSVTAPAMPPAPPTPAITIVSLPAYGSTGAAATMTGVVTGVANPVAHGVVVYICIEGSGWWLKPVVASVATVAANGSFSAPVVTGGLDRYFTAVACFLVPPAYVGASSPTSSPSLPAIAGSLAFASAPRYGPTVSFAGRTFAVKEAPLPVGPGSNVFSASAADVFVDALGRMHLTVNPLTPTTWKCTEVMLTHELGYGVYTWVTEQSQLGQLDPALVFGAFLWDRFNDAPGASGNPAREFDIEHSRWGNAADPTSSQVVMQPYNATPANLTRFTTPALAAPALLTHYMEWLPDRINFGVAIGRHAPGALASLPASSLLYAGTFLANAQAGRFVPTPGHASLRFNLWLHGFGAAFSGPAAAVVISDFRYSPPGTFRGGCGVNPSGTLVIVSGSPSLGSNLVLGIDGIVGGLQHAGSSATLGVTAAADPAFPCGTLLAGLGMTGGPGEVLVVADAALLAVPGAAAWAGPGNPVPFAFQVPNLPGLIGFTLYAQGLLFDPTQPASLAYGLTDAIEVHVIP